MNPKIETFKKGHDSIYHSIDQIQLSIRSYPQVKTKLRVLEDSLSAHFSKQNSEFFEKLRKGCRDDHSSLRMIDFLEHNIKECKIKFLQFFDVYSKEMGGLGSPKFPLQFTSFCKDILTHLQIEEEYLFPLIEEHSKDQL